MQLNQIAMFDMLQLFMTTIQYQDLIKNVVSYLTVTNVTFVFLIFLLAYSFHLDKKFALCFRYVTQQSHTNSAVHTKETKKLLR